MSNIFSRLCSLWKKAPADDDKNKPPAAEDNSNSAASADSRQVMEEVINQTYPRCALLVRDVNLPEDIAAKYEDELIIIEPGFTEASKRLGGLTTTHRFGIASNHMKDLSELDLNNRGMCMSLANSHFKVLGQHTYKGKTLILLLHLPEENWEFFKNIRVNADEDIKKSVFTDFEKHCEMEPIPELTDEEWLDRCAHPLGLDEEGEFFAL